MVQGEAFQEIEEIKSTVARFFPVYDVTVSYDSVVLFISPVPDTLEQDFDGLRKELMGRGYIPVLRHSMGEYTISVIRKPKIKTRNIWVNWVLLVATTMTTIFSGAFLWSGYRSVELFSLDSFLWGGLLFAVPLLAIFGAHELAHYLMARRHGVDASLPFFIPSIPPLGTFGAFISMRDPIPSRKALLDIGVAGPLAGIVVTIPVTLIGLFLTAQGNVSLGAVGAEGSIGFMMQPLFQVFLFLIPIPEGVALHPTAFAAWVGFLVTAINLLPAGQLDGGHIARALLGDKARYLSYVAAGLLVVMSLFYPAWLLFALIIFFLGLQHPPPLNDISGLDLRRMMVGGLAFVILLVTFVPVPVVTLPPDHSFSLDVQDLNATPVSPGGKAQFLIVINNTGNTDITIHISTEQVPDGWDTVVLYEGSSPLSGDTREIELPIELPYEDSIQLLVEIDVPEDASPDSRTVRLTAESEDTSQTVELTIQVSA